MFLKFLSFCSKIRFAKLSSTLESEEASSMISDGLVDVAKAVLEAYSQGALSPQVEGEAAMDEWKVWIKALGKTMGRKGKRLFHPVRVCLTGSMSGADVGEQLSLLRVGEKCGVQLVSLQSRMKELQEWVEKQ